MLPGGHWCCPVPGTLAKPPAKWRRLILLAAFADSIRCEAEISHLAESLRQPLVLLRYVLCELWACCCRVCIGIPRTEEAIGL